MTKSMTAFARAVDQEISWEIRSVNQRYLDANFKVPEAFRMLEGDLRNHLRHAIGRGKVDCLLRVEDVHSDEAEFQVDEVQLRKLRGALDQVAGIMGEATSPNALELLRWPGILKDETVDQDTLNRRIVAVFKAAVEGLVDMRAREGEELARLIETRLGELETIVDQVRAEVGVIQARQEQRIRDKLAELQVELDQGRLEQELVFLAQKSDVAEELDRLVTHVEEVRKTLRQTKPSGRRLDFLMQELNREANTLSSKAVAANTTIAAVELKVIIEQMREQVQNIE